ncbi:hypothetical protein KCTC52924_00126 [Arenibacter antarcticus]
MKSDIFHLDTEQDVRYTVPKNIRTSNDKNIKI